MSVVFQQTDLDIFKIPEFKKRMEGIQRQVRPKLILLGEEVKFLLMNQFKQDFFPHTAKHMRRTVNPPDETWVAFGPSPRGYKAFVYFSFCIGKAGMQARVVVKDESDMRATFGKNLLQNAGYFVKHRGDFGRLQDYQARNKNYLPGKIPDLAIFLKESGNRLIHLKTAQFDVGFELNPKSPKLEQEIVKGFDLLFPFYECGLKTGVRF
jgi:uncharacterized protein YktB (UPF0637 family)